ncbi:MAG: hypothetical protein ACKO1L_04680 [Brachymonas sp.]
MVAVVAVAPFMVSVPVLDTTSVAVCSVPCAPEFPFKSLQVQPFKLKVLLV